MQLLRVDPTNPDLQLIEQAAATIRAGDLVAFPTETVYGLGADALSADAVARIYAAKGRPAWNPVIAHVADIDGARAIVREWSDDAERVARALWPGPITLVLPKRHVVPDIVTAGLDKVAVRMPAHPVALALIAAAGRPVAAPSANRFTMVSPTTAEHVVRSLGDRVPIVLDGGPASVGIESTVLDLSSERPTILRPGMLSRERLQEVLGREVVYRAPGGEVRVQGAAAPQLSPGQASRHYAPRADVWLFDAAQAPEMVAALAKEIEAGESTDPDGRTVQASALLLSTDYAFVGIAVRRMPAEPEAYARALYAALHDADAGGVTLLLIERPPESESWNAIRDRLTRAAR